MRAPLAFGMCLLVAIASVASVAVAAPGPTPATPGGARGPPAPVGAFEVAQESRLATGDHVSFHYDDAGIQSFAAENVTLFDITVTMPESAADTPTPGRDARVQAQGSELRVRTRNYSFVAHDNPAAVSRMQTEGSIAIAFADGTVLAEAGEGRVQFELGALTGTVRGEKLNVSGREVLADRNVLIFLDEPRGAFDKHREDIGNAIAKGHVGAEATFNLADGGVQQDVVSYGNVTMTTLKAETGNLTVLVDGHGTEGRVLVLNVDGRVVGASKSEDLTVLVDNVTVVAASSLTDILDPDDDGYQPEYYLVFDPQTQAFQLLVTLPHYSVHTLSIMTAIVLPPPSVILGIVAGVALLVPSAMLLFRRK